NILDIPTEKVKPYPAPSPVGEGRGEGKTAAPLSDDRSVIPDNRLKTYNGTTYYYDNFGNLIHRELANGEVQNYFYDLHDQLVKAEIFKKDGTKETWSYTYDALGRRIGKGRLKNEEVSETSFPHDLSGNGLENHTRFVWDGSHLLQKVHPDGRYTYIYTDPDSYEPLAQVRDWTTADGENCQQTRYFHCDQIGIPREMTDKDGNLLWFGNYTGWGRLKEETKVTDSAYQPFRLQNQYADPETGLHYNFFRYYESDAGRFVNQDPIGLMGGENLYWFAPNAQDWVDPLGESGYKLRLSMESQNMFRPNSSWQTHHLIPQAVWKENKAFFNAIGMKGKGLGRDSWTNGLYMPSTEADARSSLREFFHRGSHNNYNDSVSRELKKIRKEFKQGKITAEQARQRVQDLQERLKKRLSKSISVGGCGSANSPKRLA
uniref:RHS repeat-associated core domain-containing protein n=2 Tax=Pseudomonadati TaxID=3379134 RepID=UPI00241D0AC5